MGIEVTELAVREIKTIAEQQKLDAEKVYLRLGVKGGGCSGFSYVLDLTEKQDEGDDEYYLVDHSTFTYLVLPETGFVEFFKRDDSPEKIAKSMSCFIDASS